MSTSRVRNRSERGFTIIELLVVIAIVAVLVALALAALSSAQKGSRDSKRRSDLKQVQTAIRNFDSAQDNTFPVRETEVDITDLVELSPDFLSTFPQPPNDYDTYTYISDSDGTAFGLCTDIEKEDTKMIIVKPNGLEIVDRVPCFPAT